MSLLRSEMQGTRIDGIFLPRTSFLGPRTCLELYSRPLLDPLRVMVLDLLYLAHRVCQIDDLLGGVAAREDDIHFLGLCLQCQKRLEAES